MKQSEAIEIAMDSYYFQEGRRVKQCVIKALERAIKSSKKCEKELNDA